MVFLNLFLFAQQPFEEYGYKVKVATLSQGKYEEFFDQDTLIQIGTTVLNRKTGKLVYFIQYDTVYMESNLKPDLISRWMSPDPLAEKYYDLSPYNFVANNPILLVDPDGQEIWIHFQVTNEDGSAQNMRVQYKQGKLYDEKGAEYSGGNEYATSVLTSLNQLKDDDDELGSRIGVLETSKNKHNIMAPEGINPDNPDGNVNIAENQYNDENGIPTGSTTYYNPSQKRAADGKREPRVGLAHELLGHGYDADQGTSDYTKTESGLPMYEVNAVNVENRARAATGDKKRIRYNGIPISPELLLDTHSKKKK